MTTITLNERTRAGRTLFDFAQTLAAKNKGITIDRNEVVGISKKNDLSLQQMKWIEGLKKSMKEAKEVATGKRKGNSLQSLLEEL